MATRDGELREIALHLVRRGGKRLRPALVLLLGGSEAASGRELLEAAAGVELLHVASLYHDDIMDRAPARRGAPSANDRWGNARASVAGTYLFACATTLLAAAGETANRLAGDAVADVCAGQLQELESTYDMDLPVEECLLAVERKTAALFVLPCRLGATLGNVPPARAAAYERFGRHLGVAFQIADDTLDLAGDREALGKAVGTDLAEGVYSLPVLLAAAQRNGDAERLRSLLRRAWLSAEEIEDAIALVRSGPAVEEAQALAREEAARARAALQDVPQGPVRESLERLSEHAVARVT